MNSNKNNNSIKKLNVRELKRDSLLKIIGGLSRIDTEELIEFKQGMDKVVRKKPG